MTSRRRPDYQLSASDRESERHPGAGRSPGRFAPEDRPPNYYRFRMILTLTVTITTERQQESASLGDRGFFG